MIPDASMPAADRVRNFTQRLWVHAWLPLSTSVLLALLSLGGDATRQALQYERTAIHAHEYWRLATAHLVHLDLRHLLMNLTGLAALWTLFGRERSVAQWLAIGLGSAAAIDAGLWWGAPAVLWYVGLSGVLHGVWAAAGIALWRHSHRDTTVTLAVLGVKLLMEQHYGPLSAVVTADAMPVVTLAHVYGALGGLTVAFLQSFRRQSL
jgi:rhomboid family GlyGly-CTERM serine protease